MRLNINMLASIGLAFVPAIAFPQKAVQKKPNILFIMSDDHAWQAISAYGGMLSKYAPTPNIDRIAAAGVRFNRCLVTNSISGPCRAVILTGKYSHLNGYLANDAQAPYDGSQQTFPKLLRKAGYETAIIGKWHLESDPTGFDHWEVLPGQGDYYNPDFLTNEGKHTEHGYVTELITSKSKAWIKEEMKSGKPFMLMMHHKAPHREWQPGPKELGLYRNTRFPEPATLFDDYAGRGEAERTQDMTISSTMRLAEDLKLFRDSSLIRLTNLGRMDKDQRMAWDNCYDPVIRNFYASKLTDNELTSFKYQRYLQDYLACIAAVDKSVGEMLEFLRENGLDKNTIVVYTSDQGFYLGEHGWFDKRFMFEESYKTALLMQWPGSIKAGTVNNDMVSNIDLPETFLEIAGVPVPADMQGRSMLAVAEGHTPADWRKEHFYHYYEYPGVHSVKRHYGISTERYKLIHYYFDIDEWELFDLQNDPSEMKNVYSDPDYSAVSDQLHMRLNDLIKEFRDTCAMNQENKTPPTPREGFKNHN